MMSDFLFSLVDGADADAVPVAFAEHVANALSFSLDAVGGDVVFVDQDGLHCFSACVGDFGVDFSAALWRSVTLDAHCGVLVVFEECGDALDVGELRGVHCALALTEGDGLLHRVG